MSSSTATLWHIRDAVESDVDEILRLITELAEYEKEKDSVKATPELLKKNIFEKGHARVLLAFAGTPDSPGEAVGLALYFFNYSTWTGKPGIYLEDLYVSPERRGQKIGKALFGHLARVAKENDCARIDWSVLKWNQPSIDFYKQTLNAIVMEEWQGMRLVGAGIDALEAFIPKAE
ncbi:acyl-CoA N-acyltransferase [Clavulina sp. PMI_390]|nr:acyl-CoA N-acyltransferase [Clavulina sp. PMI_390]